MIPLLPLPLVLPQVAARAAVPELDRVRAFLRVACTGLDGAPIPGYAELGAPKVSPDMDRPEAFTRYDLSRASLYVDRRTGAICGFNYSDPKFERPPNPRYEPNAPKYRRVVGVPPRRITDAQALAIARRFYAATGEPYPICFIGMQDGRGDDQANIAIGIVAVANGVPYDNWESGWIGVDHETGYVNDYNFHEMSRDLPSAPAFVPPRVSVEFARTAAFRTVLHRWSWMGGAEEAPYDPMRLVILQTPNPGEAEIDGLHDHEAAAKARAAPHRGRYAYVGRYGGFRLKDGTAVYPYRIEIDAQTGAEIRADDGMAGVGGAPSGAPKAVDLPAAAHPWRVAVGDAPWKGPVTAALVPTPGKAFAPTVQALLTDGKSGFAVAYDPKANLLAVRRDGKEPGTTYHPGPALAVLLGGKAKG